MKSFRTYIVLAAAVLVAVSAFAQSKGKARLTGKVVDEQGQPIVDVQIRTQKVGQTEVLTTKTDKNGEFKVNLADGQWHVELAKPGLATIQQAFDVKDGTVAPMNVTMTPPKDPSVAINAELARAVTTAQGGKFADARKICEDLLVKMPTLTQCYGFNARMYAAENQPQKALEQAQIAVEKEPANVDNKLLQADLLMEVGNKEESRKILDAIDLTQVKDPFPFINNAITLINEKKGVEAADVLTKLLVQFPNQAEIFYYRGRAYFSADKLEEAKADLDKFVTMGKPDSKEVADAKKILEQMVKK
jgi:Tfp pilus assembly protein PilF